MSEPVWFLDGRVALHCGDCLDVLAAMPAESVDAVVCDPPYHLTSIVKRFGKTSEADDTKTSERSRNRSDGYARLAAGGFMGKQWDGGDIAFQPATWAAVLRVLKPGGYLLAFSGTRTYHRMAVAIEDAGLGIRDQIGWCYGGGFPKSLNVSKKLNGVRCTCQRSERAASHLQHGLRCVPGADVSSTEFADQERHEVLLQGLSEHGVSGAVLWAESEEGSARRKEQSLEGRRDASAPARQLRVGEICSVPGSSSVDGEDRRICDGAPQGDGGVDRPAASASGSGSSRRSRTTEQSATEPGAVAGQSKPQDGGAWPHCGRCGKPIIPDGLGTALKPAWEPICVARKPLEGTNAENILKHGTGALNIDGCRVGDADTRNLKRGGGNDFPHEDDSWTPTSVVVGSASGRWPANLIHDGSDEVLEAFPETVSGSGEKSNRTSGWYEGGALQAIKGESAGGDGGSAARFFYTAKADADDRIGSKHPTVKPVDLMQYLCRLVTPPGGTILDPFAGTGTTGEAAWREGFKAILIEREAEYQADIARRMDLAVKPTKRAAVAKSKNKLMGAEGTPLFGGEAA